MTLKKSFFSLPILKDSLRRYFGVSLIYFLISLIALPIALLMRLQGVINSTYSSYTLPSGEFITAEQQLNNAITEALSFFLSPRNIFFSSFILLCAIATGCILFSYLHSKQPTAFFHSIPVSRYALFCSRYVAGALISLVPILVNILISIVFIAVFGYLSFLNISALLLWIVTLFLFFFIVYTLTILGGMLCGNVLMHLAMSLYFLFAPCVTYLLIYGYLSSFYKTFYEQGFWSEHILGMLCPVIRLFELVNKEDFLSLGYILLSCLSIVILFSLALLLYAKRPSEGSHKAIAFFKARPFVKYPLVCLISFASGLLFHALGDINMGKEGSYFWLYFGFLLGAILSHAIIEIIFNASFKAFFKNLKGMIVYCILGAAVLLIPVFDLTGYDTYLPNHEDIASANFFLPSADLAFTNDYSVDTRLFDQAFTSPENISAIYNMMESAVRNIKFKESDPTENNAALSTVLSETVAVASYARLEPALDSSLIVKVTLKSGREVLREYSSTGSDAFIANYKLLFESDEYKKSRYKIFGTEVNNTELLVLPVVDKNFFRHYGRNFNENLILNPVLTSDETSAITFALRKDVLDLTFEEYRQEIPVFIVNYRDAKGNFVLPGIPVYPSFKNTLAELSKLNMKKYTAPEAEDILSFYVEASPEYISTVSGIPLTTALEHGFYTYETFDPDEISEILDAVLPSSVTSYSPFFTVEDMYLNVTYKSQRNSYDTYGTDSYRFKKGEVPQFLLESLTK